MLLAWGEPVRCIAKELYLSSATVNYHLARLRRIFQASSLPALVAAASVAEVLTCDRLPVQGTGRLEVDLTSQTWDYTVPLWTERARQGAAQADPGAFAPDHSGQCAPEFGSV